MYRTVYYARVSTESSVQLHSLEEQRKYFSNYIDRNPEMKLTGEYIDEGITGTSLKYRDSFNRMIKDATNKKFDLILVKDISRFSRNTLDTIEQTRKLNQLGVHVIFVNDHIDTRNSDSEVNLTIIATIAQEESRKISSRVNWTMHKELEQGRMYITSIYGYDVVDGNLVINEEEAKIVRLIFDMYLEGNGYHLIANKLQELGIKTPKYKRNRWSYSTLKDLIANEKYKGTLVSHKEEVCNYLTHQRKRVPREKQFIFENHHEAIISPEKFDLVQQIRLEKNAQKIDRTPTSSKALRKRLKCWCCGSNLSYYKPLQYWICRKKSIHECENYFSVREKDILEMFGIILYDLIMDQAKINQLVKKVLKKSISIKKMNAGKNKVEYKIKKLKTMQTELLNNFLEGIVTSDKFNKQNQKIMEELNYLTTSLDELERNNPQNNYDNLIQQVTKSIGKYTSLNDDLRDNMIQMFLEKAIIRTRSDFDLFITSHDCNPDTFDQEEYVYLTTKTYDFKYLESKYQQKYQRTLENTTVSIYIKKGC